MDERVEASLIALRRIFLRTEMASRQLAKQYELTPTQLLCLQVLEGDTTSTPSTVARALSISHGTVTALLDRLEERGMIERVREDCDRRRVSLRLMADGEKALGAVPGSLQHRFNARFGQLDDWEKAFLVAGLERIANILDADELDAAPILETGQIVLPPDEDAQA